MTNFDSQYWRLTWKRNTFLDFTPTSTEYPHYLQVYSRTLQNVGELMEEFNLDFRLYPTEILKPERQDTRKGSRHYDKS